MPIKYIFMIFIFPKAVGYCVESEVLTVVIMHVSIFWLVSMEYQKTELLLCY